MPITTVDNTPALADALFPAFVGVNVHTPGAAHKTVHDPDSIYAEFFHKPVQDELLAHQNLLASGVGAAKVRNETGGTLTRGTLVYPSSWSAANGRFLIAKADADSAATQAAWVLDADLATATNGTAWAFKTVTGTVAQPVDTSGRAVGDKVYLSGTVGAFTFTAPTGADQDRHYLGSVTVVSATVGEIAFFPGARILEKRGTSSLQDDAITTAKIVAQAVTDAKRAPHTFSAKTGASYNLLSTDHDQSFTNQGAAGTVAFILPTPAAGLRYRIYRRTNQSITLTTSALIYYGTVSGTVYTITDAMGHVEVECDGTNWIVIGATGAYTLA